MNFKPTSWKIITSIMVGLLTGLYFSIRIFGDFGTTLEFDINSIIGFFVGFILIYIIWSLFERKRK